MIGAMLSRYRITQKLGQGGMGEVYRAEHTNLSRQVAIKVLPDIFAGDAGRLAALFTTLTVLALLALRRILPALTAPGRAALVIPLAAFPLVYYAVSYVAHYPAPLVWILLLLSGYEVQARFNHGRRHRAGPRAR